MNTVKKLLSKVLIIGFISTALLTGIPVNSFAASGDTVVYTTDTGKCYHLAGCVSLKKSSHETTLQEAVSAGYKTCSKCGSPTLDSVAPAVSDTSAVVASANTTNIETTVYIPKSGKKYHRINNCGNMDSSKAKAVSESDAIAKGYGQCSKCW